MSQNIIKINDNYCPKNHICPTINRCPVGAIIQKTPFSAPYIDETKCQKCGLCSRICPVFQMIS